MRQGAIRSELHCVQSYSPGFCRKSQIGSEAGGKTVILSGLEADQNVVASGQFLIDSEASLRGVLARSEQRGTGP